MRARREGGDIRRAARSRGPRVPPDPPPCPSGGRLGALRSASAALLDSSACLAARPWRSRHLSGGLAAAAHRIPPERLARRWRSLGASSQKPGHGLCRNRLHPGGKSPHWPKTAPTRAKDDGGLLRARRYHLPSSARWHLGRCCTLAAAFRLAGKRMAARAAMVAHPLPRFPAAATKTPGDPEIIKRTTGRRDLVATSNHIQTRTGNSSGSGQTVGATAVRCRS